MLSTNRTAFLFYITLHFIWLHSLPVKRKFWESCQFSLMKLPTVSAKLHYRDTTNEFTTILQLVVQQIHHQVPTDKNLPLDMSRCWALQGIAMWQICCRIIVSSSVGAIRTCCTTPPTDTTKLCTTCPYSRCPCSGVWAWLFFGVAFIFQPSYWADFVAKPNSKVESLTRVR